MATATGGIHFLTFGDKVWATIFGCRHNWSFPQRHRDMVTTYDLHAPFNAHQQCPLCGALRLYNTETMESGPIFKKEVKQNG
jgi:hypothetical protein